MPTVESNHPSGIYVGILQLILSCDSGQIYYTLDGTKPTVGSFLYTTPILVSQTTTVRFYALEGGISSHIQTLALQFYPYFRSMRAVEFTAGVKRASTILTPVITDSMNNSFLPIERIDFVNQNKSFPVNISLGDLVINGKIVNQFFEPNLVVLPAIPEKGSIGYILPKQSIRIFLLEGATPEQLVLYLSGYSESSFLCSRRITSPQLGALSFSYTTNAFSKVLKLEIEDKPIFVQLPAGVKFIPGTKFDLALAVINIL